jgi:tRNA threonylcarbamoyladenosine biosynthesis protein TsaB
MLLLVADTSGKQGGVGLVRARDQNLEVIEEVALVGGTFSAQLIPQIAALLAKHGLDKRDIDAFVVVSGPGSFTGLRVGLAAIKALAEILQKPIVPVSLLEVIAVASRLEGKVAAAIDAGRGEVYLGEYQVTNGSARRLNEQLLPVVDFISGAQGSSVVTVNLPLAEIARNAGLLVTAIEAVNAEMIARLGRRKLHAGETTTPEGLEANYIRRSDAEIFAKP